MRICEIEVDNIKPDANQPRKTIDEESLAGMAKSIKAEGVINPIEIDEAGIIITGELRWRAAKIAGLKTVPIKVVDIKEDVRFIRQVQENLHHNTMSPLDTARALEEVRKRITNSTAELVRDKKHEGERSRKGIKELHELFGIPESTISQTLDLLGVQEGPLQEALSDPKFQTTKITAIKGVPEKYKKDLENLVGTQKKIPRDAVAHMVTALKRAERYDENDNAEKLLAENFEGLDLAKAVEKINEIVPDEESRIKEPAEALKAASKRIIELMEFFDLHKLESFDRFHRGLLISDIKRLGLYFNIYLHGDDTYIESERLKELGKTNTEIKEIKEIK